MKIMTSATKQNRREYQEDRFFIDHISDSHSIFGVFDGHGGDLAAEYAERNATLIFRGLLALNTISSPTLLREMISTLNDDLQNEYSGTTASIVLINEEEHYADVAVIGDSPVIIKDGTGTIWVSPEHNVRTNKAEADAAVSRYGGYIKDGYLFVSPGSYYSGLQMSRALGDKELSRVLNREPEVFRVPLNNDSWILCGTDGILDPGHQYTETLIKDLVDLIEVETATAEDIIQAAISTGSDDNATAILARI